jgi:enoyl-CoA hydratase/carnithine racemase
MNLNSLKINIDDHKIINLIIKSTNLNINNEVINDFQKAIDYIANHKSSIGVIISNENNSYNFNYDLNYLYSLNKPALIFENITKLSKSFRRLETLTKPIVSIISGSVSLGGLEIILHSHYKIADTDNKTKFIFRNIKYALIPAIGASQRLPRLIGIEHSLKLFLSDKIINTEEALNINLIDEICHKDKIAEKAKEYIFNNIISLQPWDDKNKISAQQTPFSNDNLGYFISKIAMLHSNTSDHYPSVKTLISAIYEGLNTDINSGLKIEARHFTWLLGNIETKSMINTLILNNSKNNIKESEIAILKKSFVENYAAEGVRLLINGVTAAMIENAGKRLGFELGPLATADNIEIQSILPQLDSIEAPVAALIRSMQKDNRNGLSSNKGFFDYEEGYRIHLWKGLPELIPPAENQQDIKEIENRLLYSAINNIFYNYIKYSESQSSQEYDYIAINNIGLPKWTGGPFTWVKKNNIDDYIKNNEIYAKTLGSRFVINKKIIDIIQNKVL